MISDKSLARAIKTAAKSGVTVYTSGETVAIIAESWLAQVETDDLRFDLRQTLGVIVEMLGYIPDRGSILITKGKDGYMEQSELSEVTANRVAAFVGSDLCEMVRTPLYYGWGGQLWQAPDLKLFGQKATPPAGDFSRFTLTDAGKVRAETESGQAVWFRVTRPQEDAAEEIRERWEHLEKIRWGGKKEEIDIENEDAG